jgi:hypothetical protein
MTAPQNGWSKGDQGLTKQCPPVVRCSGKCGYLMPGDQLLNTSKPQVITVAGSLAPRIVRKRSANTNAAPAAPQIAHGPSPPPPAAADGKAITVTLQPVQNGERPVRMVMRVCATHGPSLSDG